MSVQAERTCRTCGMQFFIARHLLKNQPAIYCSNKCSAASRIVPHIEKTCVTCGLKFYVRPSEAKRRPWLYCSNECQWVEKHATIEECFNKRIGETTERGCILWAGDCDKAGYGKIRGVLAHRIAYTQAFGPIPKSLGVLHHCDNPPCINPKHLFLGTNIDNSKDKVSKGRQMRGEQNWNTILKNSDILEIRRLYESEHVLQKSLARQFGVSCGAIHSIVNRKNWRHI